MKAKNKVPESGTIFIKVPGKGSQVFASPKLPVDKLPLRYSLDTLEDHWETVEVLRAIFLTQLAPEDTESDCEEADPNVKLEKADDLTTPVKKRHPSARMISKMPTKGAFAKTARRLMTPAKIRVTQAEDDYFHDVEDVLD